MVINQRIANASQPIIKIYHYHCNHLGTPQELSDDKGDIIWLSYDRAWGGSFDTLYKQQFVDNWAVSENELQPFKFQGQSLDTETGLHYNRFRYYDSDVGMFVSRDPIELLGGSNNFQYTTNPINWTDPWGLRQIGYACADSAAKAALNSANPKSIRLNKEYGGLIYQKGGKYFYTVPIPGTENRFKPSLARGLVPRGAKIVGDYHTHGDYSRKDSKGKLIRTKAEFDTENSDNFSASDRRITAMAQLTNPCHTSYLGTPSGKFKANSLLRGDYEL